MTTNAAPRMIRLEPHVASTEEIEQANSRFREFGWRTRLPQDANQTLAEIADTPKPSDARLRAWISHPDEQVVRAAIGAVELGWSGQRGDRFRRMVLLRGLQINQAEGLFWNPVLDRAGWKHLLPGPRRTWELGPEEGFPIELELGLEKDAHRCVEGLYGQLAKAVAGQGAEADARASLRAESHALREALAHRVSPVPEAFVAGAEQDLSLLRMLLQNRSLAPPQVSRLRIATMRALSAQAASQGDGSAKEWAGHLIGDFVLTKRWTPSDAVDLLISYLPLAFAEGQKPTTFHWTLVNGIFHSNSRLNRGQIDQLAPLISMHRVRDGLAVQPETPIELLREIVRQSDRHSIARLLSVHPQACGDPSIAAFLPADALTFGLDDTLLRHGHGPAFRTAVVRQMARDPRTTTRRLEGRIQDPAVRASLYSADLAPALGSTDAATRESALRMVGQLQPGMPAPPPKKRRRGRSA